MMGIWRLQFRLIVGMLFVGHAAQKLFGWFDGPGLRDAGEGYETPAAAAMLSGMMNPLVLIAALAPLTDAGPGRLSLDARRGHLRAGTSWAAAALVAGGLGALAVHLYNERQLPAPLRVVEEHIHHATEHQQRLAP